MRSLPAGRYLDARTDGLPDNVFEIDRFFSRRTLSSLLSDRAWEKPRSERVSTHREVDSRGSLRTYVETGERACDVVNTAKLIYALESRERRWHAVIRQMLNDTRLPD